MRININTVIFSFCANLLQIENQFHQSKCCGLDASLQFIGVHGPRIPTLFREFRELQ